MGPHSQAPTRPISERTTAKLSGDLTSGELLQIWNAISEPPGRKLGRRFTGFINHPGFGLAATNNDCSPTRFRERPTNNGRDAGKFATDG